MKTIARQCLWAASLGLLWTSHCSAQIPWKNNVESAQQVAVQTGKPILLHFYTNNCPPCNALEAHAFKDPGLIQSMQQNVVAVKVNADENPGIAKKFNVDRWPTDVFLAANGQEIYRTVSHQNPVEYSRVIDHVSLRNRDWMLERTTGLAANSQRQSPSNQAVDYQASLARNSMAPRFQQNSAIQANLENPSPGANHRVPAQLAVQTTPPSISTTGYRDQENSVWSDDQNQTNSTLPSPPTSTPNRYRNPTFQAGQQFVGPSLDSPTNPISGTAPRPTIVKNPFLNQPSQAPAAPPNQAFQPAFSASQPPFENAPHFQPALPQPSFPQGSFPQPTIAQPTPSQPYNPQPTFAQSMPIQPSPPQPASNQPSPVQSPPVRPSAPQSAHLGATVGLTPPPLPAPEPQTVQMPPNSNLVSDPSSLTLSNPVQSQKSSPTLAVSESQNQNQLSPPTLNQPSIQLTSPPPATTVAHTRSTPALDSVPSTIKPDELGMEGYCPVALATRKAWHIGDPRFAVRHRGRVYQCENESARQLFLLSPDLYSPALSGYDLVHFLESGRLIPGKRELGCWYDKQVYLFADADTRRKYDQQAESYVSRLKELMENAAGRVATHSNSSNTQR